MIIQSNESVISDFDYYLTLLYFDDNLDDSEDDFVSIGSIVSEDDYNDLPPLIGLEEE